MTKWSVDRNHSALVFDEDQRFVASFQRDSDAAVVVRQHNASEEGTLTEAATAPSTDTPATHPLQPLLFDEHGTVRFKKNAIVSFLLDSGSSDLNKLAIMPFSAEDREQFAQLIGYSLSGFGELSYVRDDTYDQAAKQPVHTR